MATFITLLIFFLSALILRSIVIKKSTNPVTKNHPIMHNIAQLLSKGAPYVHRYLLGKDINSPFTENEMDYIHRSSEGVKQRFSFGLPPSSGGPRIRIHHALIPYASKELRSSSFVIGKHCQWPYIVHRRIFVSGMGYGSLSPSAVKALSHGARKSQILMNTGETGISEMHREGGADLVFQVGVGGFLCKDIHGRYSPSLFEYLGKDRQIKMFEVKLSQGAHPGLEGGLLPAARVTPDIAIARGIMPFTDQVIPHRHAGVESVSDIINLISMIKKHTEKPVGIKICVSSEDQIRPLIEAWSSIRNNPEKQLGIPDFITVDGAEGGTRGAASYMLSNTGLPIADSLPMICKMLKENNLKNDIAIFASGKLSSPERAAWAFSAGADMIGIGRGFMMSMGCIQALKCETERCPSGVATKDLRLSRSISPQLKSVSIMNYMNRFEEDLLLIARACGVSCYSKLDINHVNMDNEFVTHHKYKADIYYGASNGRN